MRKEIGSEWELNYTDVLDNEHQLFLRSCRDCLYTITKIESINSILLPAYSCDSMIKPFEKQEKFYYGVNRAFELNDFPFEIIPSVDAILLINYFGKIVFPEEVIRKIKALNPKIIIIKDTTQNLLENLDNNDRIDYTVCSLRKWFPIPDGGYLKKQAKIPKLKIEVDESFFQAKLNGGIKKYDYLHGSDDISYKNLFAEGNGILDRTVGIYSISEYSRSILRTENYSKTIETRQGNYDYIENNLHNNVSRVTDNHDCLYFPIFIEKRDEIQKELSKKGIFCPVIWKIDEQMRESFSELAIISDTILAIPIDQRYSEEDMKYICDVLNSLEVAHE